MSHPLLEFWLRPQGGDESGPAGPKRRPPRGNPAPADDAMLAERIRAGDSGALGTLYEATFTDLWVFARRYVGDAHAEEVVQDVFFRLWSRKDWQVQTTLQAYLYGAVRHRALNVLRREGVEERAMVLAIRDAEVAEGSDTEAVTRSELHEAVTQAIETFPERQRAAIVLRIDRSLSYSEIGDALGVSSTAAGNLVKKAEAKLRQILQAYRPE